MHPALDAVPAETWNRLAAREGAWRTPVLASATPDGADARVVVLRDVARERCELVFFTDRRSRKRAQIDVAPAVCMLIYDRESGLQVRLYGRASVVRDDTTLDRWWHDLGDHQRAHYAEGDPKENRDAGNGNGRTNFTAFRVTVQRFHCLWLRDDGNEAAEFEFVNGTWRGHPVRP